MADEVEKKVKKKRVKKYIGRPIITPKNYFKIEVDTEIDKVCKVFNQMIISALDKYVKDCMKNQREPDTFEFIEFLEEFEEELNRDSLNFDRFCENLQDRLEDEEIDYHVEES